MSAFGHAGFGSSNRRNQLRAQGQLGGDQYGQGVRSAMQAPTFNIYQAPSTYQQATGTQTQQPAQPPVTMPTTQQPPPTTPFPTDHQQPPPTTPFPTDQSSQPPPTTPFPTDRSSQPSVPSPGTAQPIQPQSQGTPYSPTPSDRYSETNEERMSRPYALPGEGQPMTYQQRLERASPAAVESAAQEWSSTPAGSQKRDWTTRQSARDIRDGIQSRAELDAETAAKAAAWASGAAFNDPARTAGPPSQQYIDQIRRQVIGWGQVPFGMDQFAFRQNLKAGNIDISGRPVTEETPDWMRYDYNKTPNPTAQSQNVSPNPASPSVQSPGTAQPIPPQSQGTPYTRLESPGEQLQRAQDEAMDPSSPNYWMNDPVYQQQQSMFANQPPEAYRPPTAEELALPPQWNPVMPNQAAKDMTYGFAPGDRTTVYSGTDRQGSVPSAQFAFEQENWNRRAQDAVNRQAVYDAMNPARTQQLLNARGLGDSAFSEWAAYAGQDPRTGLSPSQSALDQIAQIQRSQQIRSDPIRYYRELQAQGLV